MLWWVGGHLDGDGSIGVYDGRLRVMVQKSVKAATVTDRFRQLFGGSVIKVPSRHATREDLLQWVLRSEKAQRFAAKIAPYTVAKRPQFQAVAELCLGRTPFTATKDGLAQQCKNQQELSAIVGLKRNALWKRFKKDWEQIVVNGWQVCRMDKAAIMRSRKDMEAMLKETKRAVHIVSEDVSLPYIAGFLDADGHIGFNGRSVIVLLVQKHAGILKQIQSQYGGVLAKRNNGTRMNGECKECFSLRWTGKSALAFLCLVQPFLFEKAEQAILVSSDLIDGVKLKQMHGHNKLK